MSKNILIKVQGETQYLNNVPEIETSSGNYNTHKWVPEDETELADVTLTSNGTHRASDSGVYGWRKVVVDVPMELSGTTPKGETWSISMTGNGRPKLSISGRGT